MSTRQPKFEVFPGAGDGRWYWHLVGGNGEIQCPSEGYATKGGALSGARACQRNAARAEIVLRDDKPVRIILR